MDKDFEERMTQMDRIEYKLDKFENNAVIDLLPLANFVLIGAILLLQLGDKVTAARLVLYGVYAIIFMWLLTLILHLILRKGIHKKYKKKYSWQIKKVELN